MGQSDDIRIGHRQGVAEERERCAKIADAVALAAEKAAQHLSYGELYGEQCKTEAAQEIARLIRGA